ncbi:MAG: hypothetical protein GWN84_00220 [Gammaproteobacteria bacterium]|nr:hypothetical protein [Gammaproteobacteria bacterium]NIR81630.1 hypothetical protein [Gammaproteobacteria bacterium]NIR88181.1 hypothetical protein [Gammaproteobacteria bacterium]NIU02742.1 hypothetical protein [Gammaproteobacteria bacterium]NIV73341.1 hypothetical protein [Gammaproteobacteria bacterium]
MLLNSRLEARVVHATLVLRHEEGPVLEPSEPTRYPVRAFGLCRVGERALFRRENVEAALPAIEQALAR